MNTKELVSNFVSPDKNPCIEEAKLSRECLEKNSYDNSKCHNYFRNYRECKKFWGYVTFKRRRAGIKPYLPTEEERKKIYEKWEKEKKIFIEV